MGRRPSINRRRFGLGLSASAAAAVALSHGVFAQPTIEDWKQLAALSDEARKLGINVAQVSVPDDHAPAFKEIVRAIVDFIDDVDEPAVISGTNADAAKSLIKRAQALLNAITAREKQPRQKSELENPALVPPALFSLGGLITPATAQTVDASKRYALYRDGYLDLFDTCKVKPENQGTVDWYVSKLTNAKYRAAYEKLEDDVCIPWYFIGLIHALEASFNFDAHLHNGDPLSRRTVQVPAGHPEKWNPPNDWQSSAKDALAYEKFTDHLDWNLARLLFRLETYNGFRSRELHNINSPYLWSFSNHYTKGKFIADNEWSSSAVSQQCGAAVMLKQLVGKNIVQLIV